MENIIKVLPPMLSGEELDRALKVLPEITINTEIDNETVRLMALSDLYKVYVPSKMSREIYSKLYLALMRSLQKKRTKDAIRQQYENHKMIRQQAYIGTIGGSDSFTIIGTSGIGKSAAISRAIELIEGDGVIETVEPYSRIIPCLVVQCPFDSSVKGLLLEILRKVDERIKSNYYERAVKGRFTTDMLIGSVAQVALHHVGLLVVDEIQHVVNNKHGQMLVNCLTNLINNSGVSIAFVGTPESSIFFEQAMQLARRSLGLRYEAMEFGDEFKAICKTLYGYQYVRNKAELTDAVIAWLYEHSAGVVSIAVSLIHDAQEIAILNGTEELDMNSLNYAYKKRLAMLHSYIQSKTRRRNISYERKNRIIIEDNAMNEKASFDFELSTLMQQAKNKCKNVMELLKENVSVDEVQI